jgi:hypothetical protein
MRLVHIEAGSFKMVITGFVAVAMCRSSLHACCIGVFCLHLRKRAVTAYLWRIYKIKRRCFVYTDASTVL